VPTETMTPSSITLPTPPPHGLVDTLQHNSEVTPWHSLLLNRAESNRASSCNPARMQQQSREVHFVVPLRASCHGVLQLRTR